MAAESTSLLLPGSNQEDPGRHHHEQKGGNRTTSTTSKGISLLQKIQEKLAVPLVEAIGCGGLALVAGLVSRPDITTSALSGGIAVAATLACLVYAGARISGAHYNPAVTFALLLLRKVTLLQSLLYVVAQVIGGIVGATIAKALSHPGSLADPSVTLDGKLALVEISFTFALVFVILHTVVASSQQPNSFAGIAMSAALAAGASVGAVMNPGVATGLFTAANKGTEGLWARWLFPLFAAVLAALMYTLTVVTPTGEEELYDEMGSERHLSADIQTHVRNPSTSSLSLKKDVTRMARLIGPYLMECIGTYLLTLAISAALATKGDAAANAGLMLTGLVFAGGYVSGGHFNPAVTFGVYIYRPRLPELPKALGYVACQLLGALIAAGATHTTFGHAATLNALPVPQGDHSWRQALGAETTFTAILVLTVLLLATAGSQGNQYFGLAISAALTVGLYASSTVSGGGLNPAVATSLYISNASSDQVQHLWIYWVGPVLGASIAVLLTEALSMQKEEKRGAAASGSRTSSVDAETGSYEEIGQ